MLLEDQRSLLPLVLDLDGTVIHTDTFHEMMAFLLRHQPLILLRLPFWFLKGRPYAKAQLVKHTNVSIENLPYNKHILSFAQEEAQAGRRLVLATGTDQKLAQKISDHLGFFQEVIGSQGEINMTGHQKGKALIDRFGLYGFDYAGDSSIDTFVWKVSRKALVVCPKWRVLKEARLLKDAEHLHYFPRENKRLFALLQALRPLFWAFNLLSPSGACFLGMSLLSSGLFVIGDLFALEKERKGAGTKQSIFARGDLHLVTAFFIGPLFILASLFFMPSLPDKILSLGGYILLFVALDQLTRRAPQLLRWTLLGLFQILISLGIGLTPEIPSLLL